MDDKSNQQTETDGAGQAGPGDWPDGAQDPTVGEGAPVEGGEGAAPSAGAVVEPAEEAVKRLTGERDSLRDRYLRLAADFDNFRKRVARERSETWSRAQADVVANLLDALDDLARVTAFDAGETETKDVLEGIRLVERKLLRTLETAGLKKVGVEGEAFDPNDHEAVATAPAPSTEDTNLVAAVLQPGYRFGGALLRPARVQVFVEVEEANS